MCLYDLSACGGILAPGAYPKPCKKNRYKEKCILLLFSHCLNIDFILKVNYSLTQYVVENGLVGWIETIADL